MIALAVSIAVFLFSLVVLGCVLSDDWRCFHCGHYRRKGKDGWRRCEPCKTGWKMEDA